MQREDDSTAAFSTGGKGILTTTLFAAGVGPVYEEYCPYKGEEGLTETEFSEKYPDRARANALSLFEGIAGLTNQGMTLANRDQSWTSWPVTGCSYEYLHCSIVSSGL